MTKQRKLRAKGPLCQYCYGKGLCGVWAALGYRIPIGQGPAVTSKKPIPCDRCGKM